MSKNKFGLVVGSFVGLMHLVWSITIAIMPGAMQSFINWIFQLHHLNIPVTIVTPFVFMNALFLVIVTFIFGYVFGWIFAALHDLLKN